MGVHRSKHRRVSGWRGAAVLTAALLVTSLSPSTTHAARPLRVYGVGAGKTVFTGTGTKLVRIRFEAPVGAEDLHFDVHGDGRVFGFLMRKVGDYGNREGPRQEADRPSVWGTSVGQCNEPGCRSHEGFVFVTRINVRRFEGTWDFYLVGDGGNVDVTFDAHGTGTRRIDVDAAEGRTVRHEIRTLTPRIEGAPNESVYSAGDFSTLSRLDFGMLGLWAVGDAHAATAWGPCVYLGKEERDPAAAFTPGCPAAEVGPFFTDTFVADSPAQEPGGFVYVARASGPPDAPRGIGGWFTSAAQVKRFGAVGLWIDYPDVDTEYR